MENLFIESDSTILKESGQQDWFDLAVDKVNSSEDYELGLKYMSHYLRDNPSDHIAYNNRSLYFCRLGLFEQAMKDADNSIKINPEGESAYRRKA